MIFTYAIATLLATFWLLRSALSEKTVWRVPVLFWPVMLYGVSHLISTAFSIHPHTSIFGYYSRFHGGLLSTIAYITMFFALVSNVRWSDIPALIRTALIATLGVSLYAIPEHFGVSPSCVIITGEFTVNCWVQDVQTRVFATFGQPNWLAAYLLMMLPLAWWSCISAWQQWREAATPLIQTAQQNIPPRVIFDAVLGASTLILGTITLLYTRSRSGFLGIALELAILAAGTLFFFWKHSRNPQQTKQTHTLFSRTLPPTFVAAAGGLLAMLFIFFLIGTPFTPSLGEIGQKILHASSAQNTAETPSQVSEETAPPAPAGGTVLENGGTDSGKIRQIVWLGALKVWQRYPLFGSGLDTFAYSYYTDRPAEHNIVSEWDFLYNRAHNEFLNILATTGAIGLITTFFLMGAFTLGLLRDIWKLTQERVYSALPKAVKDTQPSFFFLALFAGYAGLAVSNFFGFSTVVVGALFFLYKAWWETLRQAWFLSEQNNETHAELDPPLTASEKTKNIEKSKKSSKKSKKSHKKYVSHTKTAVSRVQKTPTAGKTELHAIAWEKKWWIVLLIVGGAAFVLLRIMGMWQNDLMLAQSKALLAQGQGYSAYQTITRLVQRAPLEPTYADQYSVTLARLAAGTASQDATTAAQLADEAVIASNRAVKLNPVHINFWKNRARVFIMLAALNEQYYIQALEALHRGRELAPTDVKLLYNIALVLDALNETESAQEAYVDTLALKPDYEDARNSYAQFLEENGQYEAAAEQYRYVLESLNPTAPTATERLAELEAYLATASAQTETTPNE